jgi:hypothetical protein
MAPERCEIATLDGLARIADDAVDVRQCTDPPTHDVTVRRSSVLVHARICDSHTAALRGEDGYICAVRLDACIT